jgi:type VI secretion system protein VasI
MRKAFSAVLLFVLPSVAQSEVFHSCSFSTLPDIVLHYPDQGTGEPTMRVDGRPPATMTVGSGTGRIESARVDGYEFRFAPGNSVLDIEKGGTMIASEEGNCITAGGPTNDTPLDLSLLEKAAGDPVLTTELATRASDEADVSNNGKWQVSQTKSAFDDSTTVVLILDSENVVKGQFGAPGPARMFLRCKENTTSAYLVLNDLFLSDIQGFGTVDYRLDDQKASSIKMDVSTDNKALGVWSGVQAIPFIEGLIGVEKLVLRATPYNDSPIEASFDLSGLADAIIPLRSTCKW